MSEKYLHGRATGTTKGKRAARTVLYGRALLLLDAGEHGQKWIVAKVAEALGTTPRSLEDLIKRFVEEGLPAAIERKKRWTVQLLAEKLIELKIVKTVSPMTVCNTLTKMNLSLT